MASDNGSRDAAERRSLWFGFAGSLAWGGLGVADILVTWQACGLHDASYGVPMSHPGARAMYVVLSVLSLLIAIAAGFTSWRTWSLLSGHRRIVRAEGYERREFMALMGFFMSITLGMGIVWLTLPPLLLQLCGRAR
jgi:hypothetical protein